jgi:hypothetical protein
MSWAALRPWAGYALPASPATASASSVSSADTGQSADAGHAAPGDRGKHPVTGKPSDIHRERGRVPATIPLPKRADVAKGNRAQRLPNGRERSIPGNATDLRRPGRDRARGARVSGFNPSGTVHDALSARLSNVVRPGVPPLNNVHHRSPNPAVVAGSLNSDRRNNGAIDGTRMSRKL